MTMMNHIEVSPGECQQTTLPMSPSTTMTAIESSPSSTVDGPNPMSALASPTERLERELHQARLFLENVYLREETHVDQAKNEDDDDNNSSFTRHLESADRLKNEMERAEHELMESSLRAEEYLADLSREEASIIKSSPLAGISCGAGTDTKNEREEDITSTAKMDMKLLLTDMADLKRELNDAQEEISRLRWVACRIDAAKSKQYRKTHRRVISDPTTSTTIINSNTTPIPTVVECLIQEKNSHTLALEDDYTEDEFDNIVHKAYIANMRISNGFVENNWLEGEGYADGDDEENECGGEACFLGGFANILKGHRKEKRKRDAFG